MVKVLLDCGHGSNVAGKCSPDNRLREYRWVRELASLIEARFDQLGIVHQRTVTDDFEPGLKARCKVANNEHKKGKCILVSLHCNAAGNNRTWNTARGWSVFVAGNSGGLSKTLAVNMAEAALKRNLKVRTPDPQHLYWTADLAVCKSTACPAVLVENMFQDNKEDLEFLLSTRGKNVLCEVIVEGVCNYLGIEYK